MGAQPARILRSLLTGSIKILKVAMLSTTPMPYVTVFEITQKHFQWWFSGFGLSPGDTDSDCSVLLLDRLPGRYRGRRRFPLGTFRCRRRHCMSRVENAHFCLFSWLLPSWLPLTKIGDRFGIEPKGIVQSAVQFWRMLHRHGLSNPCFRLGNWGQLR